MNTSLINSESVFPLFGVLKNPLVGVGGGGGGGGGAGGTQGGGGGGGAGTMNPGCPVSKFSPETEIHSLFRA